MSSNKSRNGSLPSRLRHTGYPTGGRTSHHHRSGSAAGANALVAPLPENGNPHAALYSVGIFFVLRYEDNNNDGYFQPSD